MKRPTDPAGAAPHSMIPLALAAGVVRNKAYEGRHAAGQGEGELNALAAFIASAVPIYEYTTDRPAALHALSARALEGGLFRDGGKELRFIDGRPAMRGLAVNATDIACLVSILNDPEHATHIRSRFARRRAQEIRAQSRQLIAQATELRRESKIFRSTQPGPCCVGRRAQAG